MQMPKRNKEESCNLAKLKPRGAINVSAFCVSLLAGLLFFATQFTNSNALSISQNVFDYDIEVNTNCGSTQSTLKRYLLDSGYNETATAGIMGGIAIESCGYKFSVYGSSCTQLAQEDFVAWQYGKKTYSGGFGLAQWTSQKRAKKLQEHADELQKSVNNLEVQTSFIAKELKSSTFRLTPLALNDMTMPEVTWVILRDYLVPEDIICSEESSRCENQNSAKSISLSELLNNPSKYKSAYNAFVKRYNAAKIAYAADTSSCDTENGEPDKKSSKETESRKETTDQIHRVGAFGQTSSKGYYSQCNTFYSKTIWRADKSTICQSGQSIVAVANAAKYLGLSSSDIVTLTEWSQQNIKGINQSGWATQNMSIPRLLVYLDLTNQDEWLWDEKEISVNNKVEKVRNTLATGGVIIAQGDRKKNQSANCSDRKDINSGLCVFSSNGHFITIIGITSDNKLIVANPAHGKNGDKSSDGLPAENILNASNKAMAVYINE